MAAASRPVRKQAKQSGTGRRSAHAVKTYIDPSRIKPRQPVPVVIEGGTKRLTLQEQLGMAPSPPSKSKSKRRTSHEVLMAEVMRLVAERRAAKEVGRGE